MPAIGDTVSRASMKRGWAEYFNERRARFMAALINELNYRELLEMHKKLREERPDTMPLHIVNQLMEYHRSAHREVECGVCLEAMTSENARFTMCGHSFCAPCLEDVRERTPIAMLGKPECPVCKKSLNPKYM